MHTPQPINTEISVTFSDDNAIDVDANARQGSAYERKLARAREIIAHDDTRALLRQQRTNLDKGRKRVAACIVFTEFLEETMVTNPQFSEQLLKRAFKALPQEKFQLVEAHIRGWKQTQR